MNESTIFAASDAAPRNGSRFKASWRTGISRGFSRSPYNTYGGPEGTARAVQSILTSCPEGPGEFGSQGLMQDRFLH